VTFHLPHWNRRQQPTFRGDFPDSSRDITEAMQRADWDGQTYDEPPAPWRPPGGRFAGPRTWRDASGAATPAGVTPIAIKHAGMDTEPLARLRAQPRYTPPVPPAEPPAAVLTGRQAPWVMTVERPRPGGPGPTPEALEVVAYLRARVAILTSRGHLDRISQEKLAMLPADRIRNRRTTARLIVDEAAELLRCGGNPQ
jgi:hypothetical protein